MTADHAAEIALIDASTTERNFTALISEQNFAIFWRTINAERARIGRPDIRFGEAYRLWREATK